MSEQLDPRELPHQLIIKEVWIKYCQYGQTYSTIKKRY